MSKSTDPLVMRDLRYSYPDSSWSLAIDRWGLRRGEIVALIGPNGSGKSTLLKLAAGVQPFRDGEVEIDGMDVRQMDRRTIAKKLGYLPQSAQHEFDHRAVDVVGMGRYAHLNLGGFMRESDSRIVEDCLCQTDTLALKNRRLSQLSGGERQRILLASVLAQEPDILLLDEPTSALDFHHQVRFFEIVTRLVHRGLSVAVVMHDLNFASLYCERIVLLHEGRIVIEGTPEQVLRKEFVELVYGDEILLSQHPQTGRPVVFPRMSKQTG